MDAEPDPYAGGRSSKGCAQLGVGLLVAICAVGDAVAVIEAVQLASVTPGPRELRGALKTGFGWLSCPAAIAGVAAAIGLRSRALAGVPRWIVAASWTITLAALAIPAVAVFL